MIKTTSCDQMMQLPSAARLLDEEEDDQLDVESSVLQRIMLDAMQAHFCVGHLHA